MRLLGILWRRFVKRLVRSQLSALFGFVVPVGSCAGCLVPVLFPAAMHCLNRVEAVVRVLNCDGLRRPPAESGSNGDRKASRS